MLVAPLATLVFAAAHVGYEYLHGGVKTHHFMARADMPGFSNWLGLVVLPLLGVLFSVRARSAREGGGRDALPSSLIAGLSGSLAYGAALAASFLLGLEQVSFVLFVGLFVSAIAFPVFRAEYIFGFVVGMTVAFGSVIPLCFAIVFAALSFTVRRGASFVWAAVRTQRKQA